MRVVTAGVLVLHNEVNREVRFCVLNWVCPYKMGERQNKIVFAFALMIPRISTYEIHDWI